MNLSTAFLLCLANFSCLVTGIPLFLEESSDTGTTTLPTLVASSIEVKIKKATDTIETLNKNIIDSLGGTIERDAHSSIGTYLDSEALLNTTVNSTTTAANPLSTTTPNTTMKQENTTGNPHEDFKFSIVLRDLQEFEDHLKDSIRNFTATRQFAYRTMLRPMLQQVQQLRTNLTHLRNHMIGFHAVTELQQQVNALTVELGDVITSGRPGMEIQAESDSMKPLQDSFSWVSE